MGFYALRLRVLGVSIGLAAACRAGAFACEDDSNCVGGGVAGVCEPTGACSFLDESCASGRRYGETSSSDLAGRCVDEIGSTTQATSGGSTGDVAETATSSDSSDGDVICDERWWNCAWSWRVAIDVAATQTETLTDVPILITLGAPRVDPASLADGGRDLRFVTEDGALLAHEVELWDPARVSFVWVSVPSVGPSEGTRLWLYYGNPDASDAADAEAVWSSEHAGVWHLQPGVVDSSANGNNGAENGAVSDVVGWVAGAKQFSSAADRIDVLPTQVLSDVFFGGGTISAWIRPHTFGGGYYGRVAEKSLPYGGAGWGLYTAVAGVDGEMRWRTKYDAEVIWRATTTPVVLDTWHYVVVTFDVLKDAEPTIYIDGVAQSLVLWGAAPQGEPLSDAGIGLVIGNTDTPSRWFEGLIDEFRLERTVRSAEWVELQRRSMTDSLVVFSQPQHVGGVP